MFICVTDKHFRSFNFCSIYGHNAVSAKNESSSKLLERRSEVMAQLRTHFVFGVLQRSEWDICAQVVANTKCHRNDRMRCASVSLDASHLCKNATNENMHYM